MFKRVISAMLAFSMLFSLSACKKEAAENTSLNAPASAVVQEKAYTAPVYDDHEFEIAGLWAPTEMTKEAFLFYKDAGFNVLSFTNHDEQPRSSENQYYLGSKRTEEALKLCKEVGLYAYIAYGNSWFVRDIEGQDYFGETPFTKHDYYGEYKDIIKGVYIKDEPSYDDMEKICNDTIIEDFHKAYPNAYYMVNMVGSPAGGIHYGYSDYNALFNDYIERIVSKCKNPYISVDLYPFHNIAVNPDREIVVNYNMMAEAAKKLGGRCNMIMQATAGVEFHEELSEGDIRWQVYSAIAFGATNIQYYCYSKPTGRDYNYCMLMPDNKTPSDVYYYVQEVNRELQGMADAMLSYKWEKSIGVCGFEEVSLRISAIQYDENLEKAKFENSKHYVDSTATHDLLISHFTSEKYGEAYMFVNFAEKEKANTVNAIFKDCGAVAIYGGDGFDGTPQIVELPEDKTLLLNLQYGEGVFVVPLK